MNAVLENLLKLQALEFGEVTGKNTVAQIEDLRKIVPQPFLGHYDRLRQRAKKGVALIRNNVCTGCHMQQPIAKVMIVMRDEDLQLCDTCGRYLYIQDTPPPAGPNTTAPEVTAEAPKAGRVRKPRKAKAPKQPKAAVP